MDRDTSHWTGLPKALANLVLNIARVGVSTVSLGNLFQYLIILTVGNFFLIFNLNFPSFSLYSLLSVLSLQFLMKSPSMASL